MENKIHSHKYNIWTDGDPARKILKETKYTHHPNTKFGQKDQTQSIVGSKRKYTEKAIAVPPQSCASYVERKSYVTLRRPTSTSLTKSHTHVLDE